MSVGPLYLKRRLSNWLIRGLSNQPVVLARSQVPYAGVGPPLISRYRMLDARHMAQICERWAIERDDGAALPSST